MLTAVSPDPATLCVDELLPYDPTLVPYSNHVVVDNPLAFTVPFNVAELDVTLVADPVVTVGRVPAIYVTVIVSVPKLFAPSLTVTVITLSPLDKLMPEIDQLVVPLAVPLPPLSLTQLTEDTPMLSEEVPDILIVD